MFRHTSEEWSFRSRPIQDDWAQNETSRHEIEYTRTGAGPTLAQWEDVSNPGLLAGPIPKENPMSVPTLIARSSLLRSMVCAALALSSTLAAHAASPEAVIAKARRVQARVNAQAYRMSGYELSMLDADLSQILDDLRPGRNPGRGPDQGPGRGPGQGPGQGPGRGPGRGPGDNGRYPPLAECKLLGRGSHAGWTYNYRISLNGQTMEGSDQLDPILEKIAQYSRDGFCAILGQDVLTLAARGSYAGWTYNYRVMMNGEAIAGSDDLEAALATIAKIDAAGIARAARASLACQILPRGSYAGLTYNYRVGVGSEVMSGSDSYSTVTAMIDRLRQARVCY